MNEKSLKKAMFSSQSNEWQTPQELFDELDKEFHFTLDPCATVDNAKCDKFYTIKEDGLLHSWGGQSVFCNPPYGREIKDWVAKAYEESKKPGTTVVMLIPARTDTRYFHKYIYKQQQVRFIKGRVKFVYPGKKLQPAPFPSMVVVFNGSENNEY